MVNIPKDQIMEMLRARGNDEHTEEASNQLPDPVDTEQHGDLLSQFGLDPKEVADSGGGGLKFGL